jgi:CubicO group peptidase (beta-lactamase class C family)
VEALQECIDRLFATWDRADTPGCALAVMRGGGIVYQRGYGQASLEYDAPITPRTVFHVASVSKQFVACAIALLAQGGQVALDDDVRRYVPTLPDYGTTITLRHLLHHTSGLRDQWELVQLAGWRMDDVITTADVLDLAQRQQALSFRPGDEYAYCNTGYTLLGVTVERVSGQTLRAFCAERIFLPLGMENTHFHDDHTMIVKNRAYSYAPCEGGGFQHSVLSYATVGASSLFTTVQDLALWEENFYTGAVGGPDVLRQMHTRGRLNSGEQIGYALGLSIGRYKGLAVAQHSGGDAGYRCHLLRFPEQHCSIAILGNVSTLNPVGLSQQVADIVLGDVLAEGMPLEQTPRMALSPGQLDCFVGLYGHTETGAVRRVEVKDGKLLLGVGVNSGPDLELQPLAPGQFEVAGQPNVQVDFGRREAEGPWQMRVCAGHAAPVMYEVLQPVAPTRAELEEYCGTYYSPELGIPYAIVLLGEGLALWRRKVGYSALWPTVFDVFAAEGDMALILERDERRRIVGFRFSAGRIHGLGFRLI